VQLRDKIARHPVDISHPVGICLFGSHASGARHASSDVAPIVVAKDSDVDTAELEHREQMTLWDLCVSVYIIVWTASEMAQWRDVRCKLIRSVAGKEALIHAAQL